MNVIAITGGAGALGSALASLLVDRGAAVALLDSERASERLSKLVEQLGPARAMAWAGDLSKASAWATALEAITARFGAAPSGAALVAGAFAGGPSLHEDQDEATLSRMLSANVDTVHLALRALLPSMVAARRGSVVVVGSRAVERPWTSTGAAAYAASKAAAVTLAQAAAQEVLEAGVRINAVLPSTMDTPANRAAMPGADPSRWVSLPSAAGVIAFLLSDEAKDVSGAALPLYGRA